jgi:hypothetical protein
MAIQKILPHGEMGKQPRLLKHHTAAAFMRWQPFVARGIDENGVV